MGGQSSGAVVSVAGASGGSQPTGAIYMAAQPGTAAVAAAAAAYLSAGPHQVSAYATRFVVILWKNCNTHSNNEYSLKRVRFTVDYS